MKKINSYFIHIALVLLTMTLVACSTERKPKVVYSKTPLDEIVTKYIDEPNFSVILADMDYKEEGETYYHKYRIIIEKPKIEVDSLALNNTEVNAQDVVVKNTDWKKVSDVFFDKHIDDLGMTILSKKNGVLDKKASPAGYDNYVGNERYGRWESHSSRGSFWVFYGQYRFMSDLFYGPSYRYYRDDYRDYNRNYRGNRDYYGSGSTKYGTKSSTVNSSSTWKNKPNTFKSKVRSSVKKSAMASKSRSYNSNSSYSKTNRNSSRYSSSSSTRSRGGGFGK